MGVSDQPSIRTRIVTLDPRELRLLEKNARYMRHETYQQLVTNIRRDGKLTSVPFAIRDGDTYEVLSGNHRVKAAIEAGLEQIEVMVTDDALTRQQRVAIQLSHNAIAGEDDPATLRDLYDELDVSWKQYSGLDDKSLGLLDDVTVQPISEAGLSYRALTLLFLPPEHDRIVAAFEAAQQTVDRAGDRYLARFAEYDRLLDRLDDAGTAHQTQSVPAALLLLLEIVERHLDELALGWQDRDGGLVPVAGLLGVPKVPAKEAALVAKAIQRLISQGKAKTPWEALLVAIGHEKSGRDESNVLTELDGPDAARTSRPRAAHSVH